MRDSHKGFGPVNQTDVIWEDLVDAKTVELTANDNTIYNFIWIDTHGGPVAIEVQSRGPLLPHAHRLSRASSVGVDSRQRAGRPVMTEAHKAGRPRHEVRTRIRRSISWWTGVCRAAPTAFLFLILQRVWTQAL